MKSAALTAGVLLLAGCVGSTDSTETPPPLSPSPATTTTTPSPTTSSAGSWVMPGELFYPTLISVAQSNGVSLGEAEEYQLVMAGHAACTTFGMGADLKTTAAVLVLEEYLPREGMSDDALTLIAMTAASMICPKHAAAAGRQ